MLSIILSRNDELIIGSAIIKARDLGEVIVIDYGSTDRTVKVAKAVGAEVLKAKDKSDAILLGFKKAKEMKQEPLFILEEIEKDDEIILRSLNVKFVKYDDLFTFRRDNYKRIILGYEPKDPNLPEKVFYVIWALIYGIRILVRATWRRIVKKPR